MLCILLTCCVLLAAVRGECAQIEHSAKAMWLVDGRQRAERVGWLDTGGGAGEQPQRYVKERGDVQALVLQLARNGRAGENGSLRQARRMVVDPARQPGGGFDGKAAPGKWQAAPAVCNEIHSRYVILRFMERQDGTK